MRLLAQVPARLLHIENGVWRARRYCKGSRLGFREHWIPFSDLKGSSEFSKFYKFCTQARRKIRREVKALEAILSRLARANHSE